MSGNGSITSMMFLLTDLLMSKLINFSFSFLDTRSLIEEWLAKEDTRRRYITNKTDLAAIDAKTTDQVMGQYQLLSIFSKVLEEIVHQESSLTPM